jgi:hypothetical protein
MQAWWDLHVIFALLSSNKNYFLRELLPTLLRGLTQVYESRGKADIRGVILALFEKSDHDLFTPIAYLKL